MPRESQRSVEERKEGKGLNPSDLGKVGEKPVGPMGIALITAYLIVFSIFLLYTIAKLWPLPIPDGENAPIYSKVIFRHWEFWISSEVRLILIVAIAGALGSLVHALRSLFWYVGNRALILSWLPKYILLPFVGATLSLVFYFVIRGGFFSPEATPKETSPFGFAALAGLVGMFSEQAVLKLKDVAETLLTKPRPGADAKPQEKSGSENEENEKEEN